MQHDAIQCTYFSKQFQVAVYLLLLLLLLCMIVHKTDSNELCGYEM